MGDSGMKVRLARLRIWKPKFEEAQADILAGRLSHSTEEPIEVVTLESGKLLVINGAHRVLESAASSIEAVSRDEWYRYDEMIERMGKDSKGMK